MSQLVTEINDSDWEKEVLKSNQPVLVDFWAPWCGPCRLLAPTVEQLAAQFQGKAKVLKMNVDDNTENPPKYGIRGIPTLILFNKGEEVDRRVGVPNNASIELAQMIEKQL